MQKLVTTLLFFSICFTVVAQKETEEQTDDKYLTNVSITINPEAINYSGSAYENDEFVLGNVYKNEKLIASNVALRYNALRDEFEVKETLNAPNTVAKVMMRSPDIYVKILNKLFIYTAPKEGVNKPGYFLVLFEGENFSLFKKINKKFIEGKQSMNSITSDVLPSYKETESFFLKSNNGVFKEFPKSKRKKLELFGENKNKVKKFVDDEGLNLNRDYELLKAVKFSDKL